MNTQEFETMLNSINADDREELLVPALRFCATTIMAGRKEKQRLEEKEKLIDSLQEELEKTRSRLERAKEFYSEAKEEAENAALAAKTALYEKLQIARDRIFIAAETISSCGQRQLNNARQKLTVMEFNNVLSSLQLVIEEMQKCGLWAENDPVPPLGPLTEKDKSTAKDSPAEMPSKADDVLSDSSHELAEEGTRTDPGAYDAQASDVSALQISLDDIENLPPAPED